MYVSIPSWRTSALYIVTNIKDTTCKMRTYMDMQAFADTHTFLNCIWMSRQK